jgi:hypothetical protein
MTGIIHGPLQGHKVEEKSHLRDTRTKKGRRMAYFGMLRRVALVRIDVSEELSAYFIRVPRISELETTHRFLSP